MKQRHWLLSLVRLLSIIFVLMACFIVFWYTPYYSKFVVQMLDKFVPVDVNQVAAKSQQMAALTDHENLEPGSNLWIARQAYLEMMEKSIRDDVDARSLILIQARYKLLQQRIVEIEQKLEVQRLKKKSVLLSHSSNTNTLKLIDPDLQTLKVEMAEHALASAATSVPSYQQLSGNDVLSSNLVASTSETEMQAELEKHAKAIQEKQQTLKNEYINFLDQTPVDAKSYAQAETDFAKDIAIIQELRKKDNSQSSKSVSQPYAIVVLGGGLTLAPNRKDIVVNEYTRLRLETTLALEQKTKLPIVLSGVEAPYMQAWLIKRGVDAKLIENKSMNTCENSRFSSLLLQKKVGAPTVLLVTDRYHMPRTRRLFAINGIETIAVESPMPTQLSAWQPSKQNYDHSRRANYEMLASIRDIVFGNSGCREVP